MSVPTDIHRTAHLQIFTCLSAAQRSKHMRTMEQGERENHFLLPFYLFFSLSKVEYMEYSWCQKTHIHTLFPVSFGKFFWFTLAWSRQRERARERYRGERQWKKGKRPRRAFLPSWSERGPLQRCLCNFPVVVNTGINKSPMGKSTEYNPTFSGIMKARPQGCSGSNFWDAGIVLKKKA